MKIYVSWLALWMLTYAVNAESTNFADTSIPDITTPLVEMASLSPSGGDGASGDGADALGRAFHQVAKGLLRMQEARLQEQQAEHSAQESLRLQQHRAETAFRDGERNMEQKLRHRDEAMRMLREECSSSIRRMETKVNRMEEQFVPSARREDGGSVSITQLESRMDTLEAKLKMVPEQLFTNKEALIEHFKRFSSSESPSAVPLNPTPHSNFSSTFSSSPASTSTSPSPLSFPPPYATSPTISSPNSISSTSLSPSSLHSISPSFTTPNSTSPTANPSRFSQSPSSSFTTPNSTSTSSPNSTSSSNSTSPSSSHSISSITPNYTSTSTPNTTSSSTSARPPAACDEECEKQRVQLRMSEVRERARAAPSPLEELLLRASLDASMEAVRLLLDAGANVNTIDSNGKSPLMRSVSGSEVNEAVVSLLLQRGAIVNAIDNDGWTALHWAAYNDRSGRVVTLLIGAGADVDTRQTDGRTPLHNAAFWSREAAVRALLASGARKDLRAWSRYWRNKTPFDLAKSDIIRNLLRP